MLKTFLMIAISILLLSACSEQFPAQYVYHLDINKKICDRYKLDAEKIEVTFDKAVDLKNCVDTIGFEKTEAAQVLNWSRRMKDKLQECQSE